MWHVLIIMAALAVFGLLVWLLAHWATEPGRQRNKAEMYPEGYEPAADPRNDWGTKLRKHAHPSPRFIRKLNGWFTILWAITIIPTVLWLHDSILWVAFLSIYANAATHYSAYVASRSEVKSQEVEEQVVTEQHVEEQHTEED